MGKATRWFRGLLGMKKDKENVEKNNSSYIEKRENKRWGFGKNGIKDGGKVNISGGDSGWLRSYISETEHEQSKHAIAVAAATAAAADAAVAAAQAAVAVVRLTSHGRGVMFNGGKEMLAATKIQAVFRGFLARKALRALKGLVKLQALGRGYLVRKRAAATLQSMQALVRAQASARSQRARHSVKRDYRFQPEIKSRKSIERFDECRTQFHSKRLSSSYDPQSYNALDESPKIVEIDTYKPRSRSRRISTCYSEYGDDQKYYQIASSPLPCPMPARLSIPDNRHIQDYDWGFLAEECKYASTNSTPRFATSIRPSVMATPARSVCGDTFFRPYSNHPSYMANTQSFRAKLRSQSAPRQRPEERRSKRLSLNEIMASRSSFTGVRMQRSCSNVEEEQEY
ncbi:hypothetical protein LIER_22162 [Lithospermum erythrorhizon]|uniref:DUF4005 domain-containing protein n=1 Tax=Lithospermum erythrorhizon TaxID=34254 RepID=A0AAV3QT04_LITER